MSTFLLVCLTGYAFCAGTTFEMAISSKHERGSMDWRFPALASALSTLLAIAMLVTIAAKFTK